MPTLFDPLTLKGVTLRNRIAVAPMCQYQAVDGLPNDWHRVHYPALARGGAALVVVEATGVSPEGRISPACTGLWSDAHRDAFIPIVETIKAAGAVPGIQIAHAGRKASSNVPWEGDEHIPNEDPRGWQTIAPSAIPFGKNLTKVPRAMTADDIAGVQADFVAAARRADEAGFEWLMLHFAHGYLAQNFLSPLSNTRTDGYGGSAENRGRFLVETLAAVRKVWPEHKPLSVRLGVIEFDGRDDEEIDEAIALVRRLKTEGLDFLDVSMGFSTPDASPPWGPAMLAPVARRVLAAVELPGSTGWNIADPKTADALVRNGSLDVVMLARPVLSNPHWPFHAAKALSVENAAWITLPPSYANSLARYQLS
ncbi:NADH:flavin oxidoreductase/NADH oxidase [Chthonobacter albigriseus]|uniref:NADH:flavin oxidoreductase/NADH oxidase n=1 Tax=Chthonobacter albigriseus TaxID=1683161 RepID=UPI0015EF28AD|nr:NADH:flavin oxidoreductase/NADH oxidase [Chthonobacter albigriseus]